LSEQASLLSVREGDFDLVLFCGEAHGL